MKKIEAFIKTHKLGDVTAALQKLKGLRGLSVSNVRGFGRRHSADMQHQKIDDLMDFSEHAKIEIFCSDDLVEELVNVIDRHAATGLRGDGKIYVSDVDRAYKIGRGKISD